MVKVRLHHRLQTTVAPWISEISGNGQRIRIPEVFLMNLSLTDPCHAHRMAPPTRDVTLAFGDVTLYVMTALSKGITDLLLLNLV